MIDDFIEEVTQDHQQKDSPSIHSDSEESVGMGLSFSSDSSDALSSVDESPESVHEDNDGNKWNENSITELEAHCKSLEEEVELKNKELAEAKQKIETLKQSCLHLLNVHDETVEQLDALIKSHEPLWQRGKGIALDIPPSKRQKRGNENSSSMQEGEVHEETPLAPSILQEIVQTESNSIATNSRPPRPPLKPIVDVTNREKNRRNILVTLAEEPNNNKGMPRTTRNSNSSGSKQSHRHVVMTDTVPQPLSDVPSTPKHQLTHPACAPATISTLTSRLKVQANDENENDGGEEEEEELRGRAEDVFSTYPQYHDTTNTTISSTSFRPPPPSYPPNQPIVHPRHDQLAFAFTSIAQRQNNNHHNHHYAPPPQLPLPMAPRNTPPSLTPPVLITHSLDTNNTTNNNLRYNPRLL